MRKLQILGVGCPKCEKLKENAAAAVKEIGLECEIEKVTDLNKIASFGVMLTPGLVVDGDVKIVGRVASVEEIKEMLS